MNSQIFSGIRRFFRVKFCTKNIRLLFKGEMNFCQSVFLLVLYCKSEFGDGFSIAYFLFITIYLLNLKTHFFTVKRIFLDSVHEKNNILISKFQSEKSFISCFQM